MSLYIKHMALIAPFQCYIPKRHLTYHLLANIHYFGNPVKYATWRDEALNKVLKKACKNSSVFKFDSTVLLRMRDLLEMEPDAM